MLTGVNPVRRDDASLLTRRRRETNFSTGKRRVGAAILFERLEKLCARSARQHVTSVVTKGLAHRIDGLLARRDGVVQRGVGALIAVEVVRTQAATLSPLRSVAECVLIDVREVALHRTGSNYIAANVLELSSL